MFRVQRPELADDLIDLVGQQTGKDRYSDLRNREASYPILSAAAASRATFDAVIKLIRASKTPAEAKAGDQAKAPAGIRAKAGGLEKSKDF